MPESSPPAALSCSFGRALRELRRRRGVTQAELAVSTGLCERALHVIEAGGGSLGAVEAVVRALDLSLSGLPKAGDGRSIGPRVRAARLKLGLSPCDLAASAGLDSRTVRALESGRGHMASLWTVLEALDRKLEVRSGEIMRRTTSADRDDRFTPSDFLIKLTEVFGPVALDPCGNRLSPVQAERVLYPEDNGLAQPWTSAGMVYVNPPWSGSISWIRKAVEEHVSGRAAPVVMLLKSVTSGTGFQLQHEHGDILLLRRRLAFLGADGLKMGNGTVSAWPSSLTLLGATADQIAALRERFEGVLIPRSGV